MRLRVEIDLELAKQLFHELTTLDEIARKHGITQPVIKRVWTSLFGKSAVSKRTSVFGMRQLGICLICHQRYVRVGGRCPDYPMCQKCAASSKKKPRAEPRISSRCPICKRSFANLSLYNVHIRHMLRRADPKHVLWQGKVLARHQPLRQARLAKAPIKHLSTELNNAPTSS